MKTVLTLARLAELCASFDPETSSGFSIPSSFFLRAQHAGQQLAECISAKSKLDKLQAETLLRYDANTHRSHTGF